MFEPFLSNTQKYLLTHTSIWREMRVETLAPRGVRQRCEGHRRDPPTRGDLPRHTKPTGRQPTLETQQCATCPVCSSRSAKKSKCCVTASRDSPPRKLPRVPRKSTVPISSRWTCGASSATSACSA